MLSDGQLLLVALFTQALFYGIYLATLLQCFRWLIFADEGWKLREKINFIMTLSTILIFIMSTANLATTLAFELEKYFLIGENWYSYEAVMVMNVTEVFGILLVDIVLIYRCWIVCEKSWRAICVPVTVCLASLACSILFSYYGGLNYKLQTFSLEIAEIALKSFTGLYACNIAITIYATVAIIYRILSRRQNSGGHSSKRLNYIVRILAESGILYTSTMIVSLVAMLIMEREDATWVSILVADISEPLAFSMGGITFNLVLIRVYQSRVELRESIVYSGNISVEQTQSSETKLKDPRIAASPAYASDFSGGQTQSETKFENSRIAASLAKGPLSSTRNLMTDEIQEDIRSCDGMH